MKIKIGISVFLLLFLTHSAFAESSSTNPKFSFGLMFEGGKGTMGNGLVDAPNRDMTYIPVTLFAGYNIKKFRIGLNAEYMMANQTTNPVDVANTNTTGTGTSFGLRLEYYNGNQSLGLIYRAMTDYKLDKQTFSLSQANYKANAGYTIQYMHHIKGKFGFVVDYTTEEFTDSLTTGNIKWNRIGLGIVITNFNSSRGGSK